MHKYTYTHCSFYYSLFEKKQNKTKRCADTDTLTYVYTTYTTRCVFCACLVSFVYFVQYFWFRFQYSFPLLHAYTFRPPSLSSLVQVKRTQIHIRLEHMCVCYECTTTDMNKSVLFFVPSLALLVSMTTIRKCNKVAGVDGERRREKIYVLCSIIIKLPNKFVLRSYWMVCKKKANTKYNETILFSALRGLGWIIIIMMIWIFFLLLCYYFFCDVRQQIIKLKLKLNAMKINTFFFFTSAHL